MVLIGAMRKGGGVARCLVKFADGFTRKECEVAAQELGLRIVQRFALIDMAVCETDEHERYVGDLVLPASGPITSVEVDTKIAAPFEQGTFCPQYTDDLLMLRSVHQYATGQGQSIWVLDTGATWRPEFGTRVTDTADSRQGSGHDGHGHGTHVMGIAGAQTGRDGFLGVAPGALINTVKVLPDDNSGAWSDLIWGLMYAVEKGARVINMSLGAPNAPASVKDAIDYAAGRALLVAAAGNTPQPTPFFPAGYENVLSVGAVDQDGLRWAFSNEQKADLYAPGVHVFSTVLQGEYACFSGTSMAAPHVAAGATLLLEQGVPLDEVRDVLVGSAVEGRLHLLNAVASRRTFFPVMDEHPLNPPLGGECHGAGDG